MLEILIPKVLHKRLLPRPLLLSLRKLHIMHSMRLATDILECSGTVFIPFVCVVESRSRSAQTPVTFRLTNECRGRRLAIGEEERTKREQETILIPAIGVRSRRTLHYMRGRALPDPEIHQRRHDSRVQQIPSVDERLSCRSWEIGKGDRGLLRRDEGARCIDGEIARECLEREGERIVCWVGGCCAG